MQRRGRIPDWTPRGQRLSSRLSSLPSYTVADFVVVTFSQARLGIVEFTALRPKVISAGLAFIFFTVAPLVMAFQWFNLFGFSQRSVGGEPSSRWEFPTEGHKRFLEPLRIAWYLASVYFAVQFFTIAFPSAGQASHRGRWGETDRLASMVAIILISAGPFPRWFVRRPKTMTAAIGVLAVLSFGLGASVGDPDSFWLAVWFVLVPFAFKMVSELKLAATWRTARVEVLFPLLVAVLLLYSAKIYPRLGPQFGGGLPQEIVIFLYEKGPLGGPNAKIEANLIDETNEGYYIQPVGAGTAYFIPRGQVAAVQFITH